MRSYLSLLTQYLNGSHHHAPSSKEGAWGVVIKADVAIKTTNTVNLSPPPNPLLEGGGINKEVISSAWLMITTLIIAMLFPPMTHAADNYREVKIADPFIELHSGPGRGFPVFYIEERDQSIKIIKRKTDWFKVETANGTQGWVHHDQLLLTLTPEGEPTQINDPTSEDFLRRRAEAGVLFGNFSGSEVITLYGGYAFTRNVSAELALSQALGAVSSKQFTNLRLIHQMFPEWSLSPFFAMGVGNLKSKASATQAQAQDRSDTVAHIGVGLRGYLTNNFMLRAEYNQYVVFSRDNYNEDLREWKVGLAFFY